MVELTCCYVFYANSNQASLNSCGRDPLTDYFSLKSIPTLFTDWFQLISSWSIQIRTRPEKLRGTLLSLLVFIPALTKCSVNAGNSCNKKILSCGNFSLRSHCLKLNRLAWWGYPKTPSKNLHSSTVFNKLDLKQHFQVNDKVSWDIKPYDWKRSCFNEFIEVFLNTRLVPWCVHIIAVKTNSVVTYLIYILAINYMISLELRIIPWSFVQEHSVVRLKPPRVCEQQIARIELCSSKCKNIYVYCN